MTRLLTRFLVAAPGLGCRALVTVALLAAASCGDKNPVRPGLPEGVSPVSMAITGNTSLSGPGDTSQLTAILTLSDGTTRDVTGQATWHPQGPYGPVISVSAGLLRALSYGRAPFTATYGVTGSGVANVLPPGTFLLKGVVAEGGFALDKVAVEVTLATGARYQTATDVAGRYALPAAGLVTVRAEKPGYPALVRQLTIEHDEELNLDLRAQSDPAVLAGVYQLTMIASPSCTLPAELLQRRYAARIRGTQGLIVDLSGASMEAGWSADAGFTGALNGNEVTFYIHDTYTHDNDYVFIERLPSGMNLAYSGKATGSLEEGGVVATFRGTIQHRSPAASTGATCDAPDHRMEFVR
jgi:hypothetical protein